MLRDWGNVIASLEVERAHHSGAKRVVFEIALEIARARLAARRGGKAMEAVSKYCKGVSAPDWTRYSRLEFMPCVTRRDGYGQSRITDVGPGETPDVWVIYAALKGSDEFEEIACLDSAEVGKIALQELGNASGLPTQEL